MTRRKRIVRADSAQSCGDVCPTKARATCILPAGHDGHHQRYADGGGECWPLIVDRDTEPSNSLAEYYSERLRRLVGEVHSLLTSHGLSPADAVWVAEGAADRVRREAEQAKRRAK